jgi:hypothetical protein
LLRLAVVDPPGLYVELQRIVQSRDETLERILEHVAGHLSPIAFIAHKRLSRPPVR